MKASKNSLSEELSAEEIVDLRAEATDALEQMQKILAAESAKATIIKKMQLKKNIACLESLWDTNIEKRASVAHLLQDTAFAHKIRCSHQSCNTQSEFEHNLRLIRTSSFDVLYLAFHGSPGTLHFSKNESISLSQLADLMGVRFAGRIVHFGSCKTIKAKKHYLENFIIATQVAMVAGYEGNVGWTEGVAMDLLFFHCLQNYTNLNALSKHIEKKYPDLVEATSFKMIQK